MMKIRFTPGALVFLGAQFFTGGAFLASLLAAVLHECGHLLAARLMGIQLRLLEVDVLGARLYPRSALPSYGAEAALAAAGPTASLLFALPLIGLHAPFADALRLATLSFALFNLLPIEGFDGGRILSAFLSRFAEKGAERVLFCTSYLCLLLLFSLSACLLLRYGENAALAVLSATLFAKLFLSLDGSHPTARTNPEEKRGFGRI